MNSLREDRHGQLHCAQSQNTDPKSDSAIYCGTISLCLSFLPKMGLNVPTSPTQNDEYKGAWYIIKRHPHSHNSYYHHATDY